MQRELVNNFSKAFPEYVFDSAEAKVDGIGRIDILAHDGDRAVLIELKTGHRNPNIQLIAYSKNYDNPILIGIAQEPIPDEIKIPEVRYEVFDELKKGVDEWVS